MNNNVLYKLYIKIDTLVLKVLKQVVKLIYQTLSVSELRCLNSTYLLLMRHEIKVFHRVSKILMYILIAKFISILVSKVNLSCKYFLSNKPVW